MGIIVTKYSDTYHWEKLESLPIILEGLGCLVIVAGNLIFNGVILIIKSEGRKNNDTMSEFKKSIM